jgi:hypothetical protein
VCGLCKPGYKQIRPVTNDWCDFSPEYWSFSLTKKRLMGFGTYNNKYFNDIDGRLNQWSLISLIDVTNPQGICIGCEIQYTQANYFSGNTTYLKLCFDEECLNQIETFRLNVEVNEYIYAQFAPLNYQNTIANPRVMPKSVGCYYNYGPGYEDQFEELLCNVTSKIYGNEGEHKNLLMKVDDTYHSTSGGICICEDG